MEKDEYDELMVKIYCALNKLRDAEQTLARIMNEDESRRIKAICKQARDEALSQASTTPIEDLCLPIRYLNSLKNFADIHTVEHLIQKTVRELKRIPNIGIQAITCIQDALAQRNLSLRESRP